VAELLLLPNSTAPGMGFLEHALGAVREVLDGRPSVLFVPFASSDPEAYTALMRDTLARIDTPVRSLREADDVVGAVRDGFH
jgi:dipeptidase E